MGNPKKNLRSAFEKRNMRTVQRKLDINCIEISWKIKKFINKGTSAMTP
jgi:hypothetical protein